MNTRSLALGITSLVVVPISSLAQGGNVQIYGTLNVDFENVRTSGATPASALAAGQLGATPTGVNSSSRNRVTSNSSNIGFKGVEDAGGGLSVIFQVESAVGIDNQATLGANTASGSPVGGGFATRNTNVGLAGPFGTLFYGQWDTPYKTISGAVDPLYFTGIAYSGAIIGTPGFGIGPVTNGNVTLSADGKAYANPTNASFERRQGNSVQYWTPTLSGFTARIAYSVNEGKSSDSPTVTQINPTIWGANAQYENGAVYVAWGYERHEDYFGLGAIAPAAQAVSVAAAASGLPSASSRDTGNKLVARYVLGNSQIGLIYERLKYEQTNSAAAATAFKNYNRDAYAVTFMQKIGAGTLRALYGKAQQGHCSLVGGGDCSTAGLGARQYTLGYSYRLSPRTDLYGFYTRVANEANATYQFANAAGIGASAGADNSGSGLGIRHTF
jgi:predicted porin